MTRVDVCEDGARARANDGSGGGEEGEGRGDDLGAFAHVEREQREQQGVRARPAADRVRRARVGREFLFEQPYFLAENELLRVEDTPDGLVQLLAERRVLLFQVEQGDLHLRCDGCHLCLVMSDE